MHIHGRFCRLTFILVAAWFAQGASAATLDAAYLPVVKGATFEVVLPKLDDAAARYEKPLPLEKLPFQYRNDKYNSIGTAFAIGKNRFVTAFHVVRDGIGGRTGAPLLRDSNGKVFAID
ncbi:MAG: serine protease, partial [Luteibacter sp.]